MESLSTPCAPHFYLHPVHTFLPVCVCMCVFGRLGPSLEHTECCSFTARRWGTFPTSGC